MSLSSISLGSDSLGLGQMFGQTTSAITSATGTAECGSKPTCIAITKTCKEKNRVYNECRLKALDVKNSATLRSAAAVTPEPVKESLSPKVIIIGLVVLVAIVLLIKK